LRFLRRGRSRELHQWQEARARRIAALASWGGTRKHAELVEQGQPWSDAQISYDLDETALATCEKLQPIEREMRSSWVDVRFLWGTRVEASCTIDVASFVQRFGPPARHSHPPDHGRTYEDPRAALISCDECESRIETVHPLEATAQTPTFPGNARGVPRIAAQRTPGWMAALTAFLHDPSSPISCQHLHPIELAMREGGVPVLFWRERQANALCLVDFGAIKRQLRLPSSVHYVEEKEPQSHKDPPGAWIQCDACNAMIHVAHRMGADPRMPYFP